MRLAISIPQYAGDGGEFDPGVFRSYLRRAEELGFESAWVQEHVLGSAPTLSALGTLTYAAGCTERLRLGCAVFVSPLHSPVHLAKSITPLDCLSGGRVEVGVALGGPARPFGAFGIDGNGLVARFTEGLDLMRACWTEREVNFDGRFWQLSDASMEPKPLQRPHPPVWIGGNHPAALRRAVRLGDGFFGAGSESTAAFAEQTRVVREELARCERDPATFQIAKRVYVHVADDPARAQERIERALARHYGHRVPGVSIFGPPLACIAGLERVANAGAELILVNPLVDDREQLERLAAEVIPGLPDAVVEASHPAAPG